jgi:uncharacterized Tic20 family protein
MNFYRLKQLLFIFTTFCIPVLIWGQRLGADEYMDEEDIEDFNRYAHFQLSSFEWWSIVVGVILIFIAREIGEKQKGVSTVLYIIGGLASLPLVLVILALAQKAIGYALALAIVVGALYFLFGKKS